MGTAETVPLNVRQALSKALEKAKVIAKRVLHVPLLGPNGACVRLKGQACTYRRPQKRKVQDRCDGTAPGFKTRL